MQKQLLSSYEDYELKELVRSAVRDVIREHGLPSARGRASDDGFLTIEEACALAGLAKSTMYEKTHAKLIPHYKRGRRLYFRREEVEEWIAGGRVDTQSDTDTDAATILNRANQRAKDRQGRRRAG